MFFVLGSYLAAGCAKMPLEKYVDSLLAGEFAKQVDTIDQSRKTYYEAVGVFNDLSSQLIDQLTNSFSPSQELARSKDEAYRKSQALGNDFQNTKAEVITGIMQNLIKKGYAKSTDEGSIREVVNTRILVVLEKRMQK